jgi:hypothetical protein
MKEPMQLPECLQAEYGEKFEQEKIDGEFDALANKAFQDDIKAKLSKDEAYQRHIANSGTKGLRHTIG